MICVSEYIMYRCARIHVIACAEPETPVTKLKLIRVFLHFKSDFSNSGVQEVFNFIY